jgi:hypothetical protein
MPFGKLREWQCCFSQGDVSMLLCSNRKSLVGLLSIAIAMCSQFLNVANAQDYRGQRNYARTSYNSNSNSTLQQYRRATAEFSQEDEAPPINYGNKQYKPTSNVRRTNMQAAAPEEVAPVENGPRPNYGGCTDGSCGCGPGPCMDDCSCGDCNSPCCISDCLMCNYFSKNGWYIGGDYIYATEHYSEPVAFMLETTTNLQNGDTIDRQTPRTYDFDYNSNYRFFGGFRWGSCGEAINFSYFHYGNSTEESATVPDPNTDNLVITTHFKTNNSDPGDNIRSTNYTKFNVYDIDYSKRIPICSCNSNPCDCCQCPPWAITWSAGVRFADLNREQRDLVRDEDGDPIVNNQILTSFTGVGPRVTAEGRRFFGDCNRWSLFGKSGMALLLGDYSSTNTKIVPDSTPGLIINTRTDNYRRLIPMMEIDVGVSRQFGTNTLVTAGYFFQAWWDLGMYAEVDNIITTGISAEDDSNIMALDGFMLRIEHTF